MKLFHKIAESTGWTWDEIGEMSIDQLFYVATDGQEDTEKEQLKMLERIEEIDRREAEARAAGK